MVVGADAVLRAFEGRRILSGIVDPEALHMPYVPLVPRLSEAALPLFTGVWVCLAVAFLLGSQTTLVGTALFLMMGYVVLMDAQAYSNHLYLMTVVTVLLVWAKAGRS